MQVWNFGSGGGGGSNRVDSRRRSNARFHRLSHMIPIVVPVLSCLVVAVYGWGSLAAAPRGRRLVTAPSGQGTFDPGQNFEREVE